MHKAHAPVKPSPCSRAATGCSKPSSVSSFTLESSAGRRRSSSPILSRGLQPAHPQRPASAAPRLALELRRVMSVSNVSSPTIPDSSNGTYQHIRSNLCTRLSGSGVLLRPHSPAVEHDGTHASTPINRPGGGSSSHDNAESLAGRGAVRASAAVASPSCTGSPRAHADGLRLLHDDPVPADAGTDATALERAGSSGSPLGCRRYDVPGWFERQDWPVPGRFSQELVSTPPLRADRSPRQHTSPLEGGVLIGSAVRGHSPRPHAAAAGDGSRQAHETLARRYQYDLPRGPSSPWSLSHAASSSMAIDGNRCQSSDMCTVCGICGRRVSRSPRQSSAPLFDLHHPSTPFTPLVAPSGPSRVLVREGNPSLGITFRPDALSAAGLEQALAAAKRTVIPGRAAGVWPHRPACCLPCLVTAHPPPAQLPCSAHPHPPA